MSTANLKTELEYEQERLDALVLLRLLMEQVEDSKKRGDYQGAAQSMPRVIEQSKTFQELEIRLLEIQMMEYRKIAGV